MRTLILCFFLTLSFVTNSFSQIIPVKDIQGTSDISPYKDQIVTVKGAVTGVFPDGYFLRDSDEEYGGLYIYDPGRNPMPARGDTLQVTGKFGE